MDPNTNVLHKAKDIYSSLGVWLIVKVSVLLALASVSLALFISGLHVKIGENSNSYNIQDNYFYNIKLLSPPYFKSGGDIIFFSQFYLSKNFHENSSFVYMLSNGEDRYIFAVNETFNGIKYRNIKVGDNFSDYIRVDIPESFQKSSYDISVGFAYDEQPLDEILARTNVDNLFIKIFTIHRITDFEGAKIALSAVILVLSLAGLSIAIAEILLPRTGVNMLLSLTAMLMSIGIVFLTMVLSFSFAASMWAFGRVIIPEYLFILTMPFFIIVLLYSFIYLVVGRIDTALYLTIAAILFLAMQHIRLTIYQDAYDTNMLNIILGVKDFMLTLFNDKVGGTIVSVLFFLLILLVGNTYRRVLFRSSFNLRFYLFTGVLIINIVLYSTIDYALATDTSVDVTRVMNKFEFFGLFLSYFTTYINL